MLENDASEQSKSSLAEEKTAPQIDIGGCEPNFLRNTRAYLSGPMGFIHSRQEDKELGWRSRLSQCLQDLTVTVLNPWHKPEIRGLVTYGKEDVAHINSHWSFANDKTGDKTRAECAAEFSSTVKIDLRMVDSSDFIIAYCPTNIYSVGTVHEIVRAREQSKPVLLVSPRVDFPKLELLRKHLEDKNDTIGSELLNDLVKDVPIKPNLNGVPSTWYMALVDGNMFFDGFGFEKFREKYKWEKISMDELEERNPPKRPLLPYLFNLRKNPTKFDLKSNQYEVNDDWLIW